MVEGTRIGNVRIECLLGEGGMGKVYRGFDEKLERTVAVKVLTAERKLRPEAKARFLREARLLSRLDDPGICRIHDLLEDEETDYLILEYIDGVSLAEALDREADNEHSLRLFLGIARALKTAHREGIVHRDLKPDNVMITSDGRVKVLDFGIARSVNARVVAEPAAGEPALLDAGRISGAGRDYEPGLGPTLSMADDTPASTSGTASGSRSATLHTRVGSLVGTIRYMSPEQASGAEVTEATDLYSLGVIMQEAITGEPVYGESSGADLLLKVYRAETAPVVGVDPDVARLIEELTRIDPKARPDAEDVSSRLQSILDRPRIMRRRRLRLAAVATVAGAVLVAGAVSLNARFQARRQAELAQSFARQAEEIAWRMRAERLSPVHDIRPAKEHVRRMMTEFEERMAGLGAVAAGPGHAALGRGHLALGELDEARRHLEAAFEAGFRSPESDFALGLTLGGIYRRTLARTVRISDPERRAAMRKQAELELRDPAVELLAAYRGQAGVMADYGRGLIAMYEERYEEALDVAKNLGGTASWFYEAHQLEGDIHRELSARAGDADRDVAAAEEEIGLAVAAFERATEIGRSDADLYSTLCGYRFREIGAAIFNTDPMMAPEAVKGAFEPCETALIIDPDARRVESNRASLTVLLALAMERHGQDAAPIYERATEIAARAVELDPDDPGTHTTLGWAETLWADAQRRAGTDPSASVERSIAAYERALELLGTEPSIITFIGNSCWVVAAVEASRGMDPRPWIERGLKWIEMGLDAYPDHANLNGVAGLLSTQLGIWERENGLGGRAPLRQAIAYLEAASAKAESPDVLLAAGHAYAELAWARVLQGLDPTAEIETAIEMTSRTAELFPGFPWAEILRGYTWLIRAELAWLTGEKVAEWLDPARAAFDAGLAGSANLHSEALSGRSAAHLLDARVLLEEGRSPQESLGKARADLDAVLEIDRENADARINIAELEILDARSCMRRGASPVAAFERGLSTVEGLLTMTPGKARSWLAAAELQLWRARWMLGRGDDASEVLEAGMEAVARALELNPRLGDAELVRAELVLEGSAGDEERRRAMDALDRALELNAHLERRVEDVRRAHGLADEGR